jgi:spore maturation protein CgeB
VKFTFFGLTISSSWGNGHATPYRALVRGLTDLGHTVTFYERDVAYYAKRRDLTQGGSYNLVLYQDWGGIRRAALREAGASDVVITASYLPGGARINDELLQLSRPLHVFYDLDTPVTLERLRRDEAVEYIRTDQLAWFGLVLSFTGGRALEELRALGAGDVAALYGCVDPKVHFRVPVPEQYRCDFSYMGTYSPDRQKRLQELFLGPAARLPERRFVLAGSMYPPEMQAPENVRRFEHVSPPDHAALYSSSPVTLNLTRAVMAQSGHCPSGRLFEAAACGTAVISDRWPGIEEFFNPGEEIVLAQAADDVTKALQQPAQEWARMAARARERTLDQHTGKKRAQELVMLLERAMGGNFAAQPVGGAA